MAKNKSASISKLSEIKDIHSFKAKEIKSASFWKKPNNKVMSWASFKDSAMGNVFDGYNETKDETLICTSPIGLETQIVWSDSRKDSVFLLSVTEEIGADEEHSVCRVQPIARIEIPEEVLDKNQMSKETLRVFTFNFMDLLRIDISNGNTSAMDFVREWGNDNKHSNRFIKMAIKGRVPSGEESLKGIMELISDEEKFKEIFPDVMTFSEWKKSEGIESNDEILHPEKRITKEMRDLGVDVDKMGEA
jgi:hypothetical protein